MKFYYYVNDVLNHVSYCHSARERASAVHSDSCQVGARSNDQAQRDPGGRFATFEQVIDDARAPKAGEA